MYDAIINKRVLVRCPQAGLFIGRLTAVKSIKSSELVRVSMTECQRIWSWSGGAIETIDLATRGPKNAKLSPVLPGTAVIGGAREIFELTADAASRYEEIGVWS